MPNSEIVQLPTADLHFDWKNPRLAEYGITDRTTDDDIITILWDAMDVKELVQSISACGFFPHEPLIVTIEDEKYIVIEGNRRLAAVKALTVPDLAKSMGWGIPTVTNFDPAELNNLPATISGRKDAWHYLGFKHVNGPAKWTSYAKAKYISSIHNEYNISLEDIAEQIGDRHKTVQRLYRGLMVIEQAERENVYDREDRFRQRFAFSHLYTGLGYNGISKFLTLKPADAETRNPVPREALKKLGELCVWLYGSKKADIPPVVQSQNPHLGQLDDVLANLEAVDSLRKGNGLAASFELSLPPTKVFGEALLAAKRELQRAASHLTAGYDNSEELLRIAGTVANLADDIYEQMERKISPGKKARRTES
ncbi:MAG: ParB N-terminal domain-containing protein [candidate division Zixibacteria bacterium]|nr:ParB N-terminal domain-containing protein [candidate division Zixibacteria bacterium]MDH3938404.1 ParB N-terminal domain-containing protein [candidate division Zixibacteria bacterium]MDH4035408.1 ParB N-terminal domain-containing protein [candidate division Zixibacteria bacterium]